MFKRRHHFVVFEDRFVAVMRILDQTLGCERWRWDIVVERPIMDEYRFRISMRLTKDEWVAVKNALYKDPQIGGACSEFR